MTPDPVVSSPNAHITAFLGHYCGMDSPGFAVMLNGKWGTGKTWFAQRAIAAMPGNNCLYVSLYGLLTPTDIDKEIFRQLHPVLGHKSMQLLGQVVKGTLKLTMQVDTDRDGKPDGSVAVQIPDIDVSKLDDVNRRGVLFFDDFERCGVEAPALLGYINSFVEHHGLRVVILANESEVKHEKYGSIREKVVGRTFDVAPETEAAVASFLEQFGGGYGSFLTSLRPRIIQVFRASQTDNLRLLRRALQEFELVHGALDDAVLAQTRVTGELLIQFLMYSFETRTGNVSREVMRSLRENLFQRISDRLDQSSEPALPSIVEQMRKYLPTDFFEPLVAPELWVELLFDGRVDPVKLNAGLRSSPVFASGDSPVWQRIFHYLRLTDAEFETLLQELVATVKDETALGPADLLHTAGLLAHFNQIGLSPLATDAAIALGDATLERMPQAKLLWTPPQRVPPDFDEEYGGYGFSGRGIGQCDAFQKRVEAARRVAWSKFVKSDSERLLATISTEPRQFQAEVTASESPDSHYARVPVLRHIPAADFVAAIVAGPPEAASVVSGSLRKRYRDAPPELQEEADWLGQVGQRLTDAGTDRGGSLTGYKLLRLRDTVDQARKDLVAARLALPPTPTPVTATG